MRGGGREKEFGYRGGGRGIGLEECRRMMAESDACDTFRSYRGTRSLLDYHF